MNIITIKVIENPNTNYKFLVDKTSSVSDLKEKLPLSYKNKIYFINKKTSLSIDEKLSFVENNLQDNDELLIILRLSGSYELTIELVNNQNIQYVNITVDDEMLRNYRINETSIINCSFY
jgi:hypothetical protein